MQAYEQAIDYGRAEQVTAQPELLAIEERIQFLLKRSTDLAGGMENLADRVFGSRPSGVAVNADRPPSGGAALNAINARLSELESVYSSISDSFDRLRSLA